METTVETPLGPEPPNGLEGEPAGQAASSSLWVEAAVLLLLFGALALALSRTAADPDLWGHLRFGLEMLRSGQLARLDPYSYTAQGLPWTNHEWLAEAAFALVWQAAGSSGLILLKMVCWLAALAVMVGYLLRLGLPALRVGLLVLPAFLLMVPAAGTVRPHMFTALGFALTVLAILLAEEGDRRWLWGLPLVYALWVNLHGGFLSGLLFLVAWAVLYLLEQPQAVGKVLPPVVLSLLALLLNPYGFDLLIFLGRTALGPRPDISEWASLPLQSWLGAAYLLLAGICGLAAYKAEKLGAGLNGRRLALLALAAVLPLAAQRHVVLFAIAAPLLAGPAFLAAWPPQRSTANSRFVIVALSLVAGIILLALAGANLERIKLPKLPRYPTGAVALIQQSGFSGNMAVNFDWGEYAIWHLAPAIKVSVDGRRETVYPDEIYRDNLRLRYGTVGWDRLLRDFPTDIVLARTNEPTDSLLRLSPDWTLVYADDASVLYARRGSLAETRLLVAAPRFQPPAEAGVFP